MNLNSITHSCAIHFLSIFSTEYKLNPRKSKVNFFLIVDKDIEIKFKIRDILLFNTVKVYKYQILKILHADSNNCAKFGMIC